jgi:hypothetical protein
VMLLQLGHGRHPQFRFFLNQECRIRFPIFTSEVYSCAGNWM